MTSVHYSVSLHNLSSGGKDLPEPVHRGPAWGLAGAATTDGGAPGEASLHPGVANSLVYGPGGDASRGFRGPLAAPYPLDLLTRPAPWTWPLYLPPRLIH